MHQKNDNCSARLEKRSGVGTSTNCIDISYKVTSETVITRLHIFAERGYSQILGNSIISNVHLTSLTLEQLWLVGFARKHYVVSFFLYIIVQFYVYIQKGVVISWCTCSIDTCLQWPVFLAENVCFKMGFVSCWVTWSIDSCCYSRIQKQASSGVEREDDMPSHLCGSILHSGAEEFSMYLNGTG